MTQRVRRVVCYHLARRRTGVYRLRLDDCPSYSRGAKGTARCARDGDLHAQGLSQRQAADCHLAGRVDASADWRSPAQISDTTGGWLHA